MPPPCSKPTRRRSDEPARPDPAAVLHRTSPPPTSGQPGHRRLLPRQPPAAARLRRPNRSGKAPSALGFDDLDADAISAFLTHLELDRHNTARTRNNRLAAIRALFSYAALRHPEHAEVIARVLAIPQKRHDKAIVSFLTHEEAQALLAAPDPGRWEGRRDRAMLAVAIQTGLRLAELTGLDCGDVTLGAGAHLSCTGKGSQATDRSPHHQHRRRAARVDTRTRRARR